jgi:Flp pilus assembly protein TadG
MLMLLPFLALFFLIIDTSWCLFIKATLQYAAQAGVTFAASDTTNGLVSLTQSTVSSQSLSLVQASGVTVQFFTPTSNMSSSSAMTSTAAGANATGNIVQVVINYSFQPLAPLFRSGVSIPLTASAAAVITATPPPTM